MDKKYDFSVSIYMVTYNHEPFLEEAIDSILAQKTNFDYQLVIGEDCSTDNTRKVLESYAAKFPKKIKLLPFGPNMGMSKNIKRTLRGCTGKYIAICEGDDYWTDEQKLQLQIDFLESNLDCAGCFHDVSNVDENSKVTKDNFYEAKQSRYSEADCLTHLGSKYASCSLVFRRDVLDVEWPNWFNVRACDEFIDLMISRQGSLAFIPNRNMGMYRIHSGGIWQGKKNIWKLKESIYRMNLLLEDEYIRSKYKDHLVKELKEHTRSLLFHKDLSFKESLNYFSGLNKYFEFKSIKSIFVFGDFLGLTLFKKSFLGLVKKKMRLSKVK